MKKFFGFIIFLFIVTMLSACSNFDVLFRPQKNISSETLNHISTVIINSNLKIETETYLSVFGSEIEGPYRGAGSGVIIKKDNSSYYILTNYHVVYLSDEHQHRYTVEDIYNNNIQATLVIMDSYYDLAILKFNSEQNLDVLALATDNPSVGELVFSIGNPLGKNNIVTAGTVLNYSFINNVEYKVIIHDAIIRSGSSGSMLINSNYQIVGINTWGIGSEVENEYVKGGATPIESIHEFFLQYKFSL